MVGVKLVIVGGGTEGDEFFPTLPAVLGRSRGATLPLPHPLVSRNHCELLEKDGRLFVRDLGSTNGTFVGSERVDAETVIEHGSLLTIGTVTFRAFYLGLPEPAFGEPELAQDELEPAVQSSPSGTDTSELTRIDTGRAKG